MPQPLPGEPWSTQSGAAIPNFPEILAPSVIRRESMHLPLLQSLQERLKALEAVIFKRENVIRFLILRFLLMLAMVIGFWAGIRQAI